MAAALPVPGSIPALNKYLYGLQNLVVPSLAVGVYVFHVFKDTHDTVENRNT